MSALIRYVGAFAVLIALAGYATGGAELLPASKKAEADKHLKQRSDEVIARQSPADHRLVRTVNKDAPPKVIIETPKGPLVMTIIPDRQRAKRKALRRYLRAKRRALLKRKLLRRYLHEMLEEKLRQREQRKQRHEQNHQRWLKAHKQDVEQSRQLAPYSI